MEEEDEYAAIKIKPLKLKQKDKGNKQSSREVEQHSLVLDSQAELPISNDTKIIVTTTTKAEQAFHAKQEKIAEARILKKASKTHKQRVEEFNKHLDSLSEHYDIPKVSWTK